MALALYRKYRPATFAEVVGQDHVTEPLRTALASGRINHAYLFSGPRGCGKTSSARILARSLNCAEGPTADPCGTCDSCVALAPEGPGSVDVVELDAASHGGVDDTRELRDRAFFAPAQSRYRIFVIDEAHMVTPQGFNALLKIVEEPPEHLIFVFATTEPDKVLTTIRSRTHHYPFRLMPPGVMRELLERICADVGVTVQPAVFPLVIRAGGGSARDTLSVLDQLLAGAGSEGITYERAVALLGVTDVALIDDMVNALAADDGAAVYGTVDRLVEAGHDPRRFGADLLDRLRDLVLLHTVPDAPQRGLVDAAGDELTTMQTQADQLGAATLTRFAEIVHTGLAEMRGATAPRLLLELLCARMLLPTASDGEGAVLQRLERVERRMTIASPASGAEPEPEAAAASGKRVFTRPTEREKVAEPEQSPQQSPEPAGDNSVPRREEPRREEPRREEPRREEPTPPADAPAAPAPAQEPSVPEAAAPEPARTGYEAADIRRVWTQLLQAVAERNRPTQALLLNAKVQELRDNTLVLSMPTSGLARQFAQQHRIEFVRDALRSLLGDGEWEVRCVEEGAQPQPTPKQQPASKPQSAPKQSQAAAPQAEKPRRPSTEWSRSDGKSGSAPSGNGNDSGPPTGNSGGTGDASQPASGPATRSEKPQRESTADDDIPPPPEPPDEEPPPDEPPQRAVAPAPVPADEDEESMIVDSTDAGAPPGPARDSHDEAVELFASELGARTLDT
ncbi:DNA polymerase III subunit gamma and tau [Allosaccharopolyspora coralli]|uniref:DNA polymerase III subunit gamma/tau n=1 Tax=Allosaccharopolyspora coralli TaxID=2665642 RepID=A0A5Q3Q3E8_9PSEU|nr:DNA polymerase III subunit gamma and tau [Allosaccharopolyspora coralli]QGK68340.1 DNA polymerase III subunit gamma and tau [Allosaccharopolyspora coralli]